MMAEPARQEFDDVLPETRARMSQTKVRDTAAEMKVRRILHAHGWRYRVSVRPVSGLRRTGDIVFTRRKLAVLIDGCFWHGCPIHYVIPKTRTDFWTTKIEGNRQRDQETSRAWEDAGWTVMRFWEHEDPEQVAQAIELKLTELDAARKVG